MFCGCSAEYAGAPPNTHVCPICLGMPGVLPVINRKAVEYTIKTALALNCQIPEASKFDRKNYPYPDLPKGYQISQYDLPFSRDGWLDVEAEGELLRVGMERVHLEEDTAKLTHVPGGSLIDFNRSGVPLMEIVSKPDLRSPEQALEFELARQTELLERGERIAQETRGWIEDRGITVTQRSKEFAHDYRYFPEPDLPPVFVAREWVAEIQASLPELPDSRRERFMREYGLVR